MTITVAIDLGHEFTVKAPFQAVWAVLSDIPTSARFFPHVEQLTDLGGNSYRWQMEKVGAAQVTIQTVYASQYAIDKAKGSVVWTPRPGEGNARVGGSWQVSDRQGGTGLAFKVAASIDIPLPMLMKMVVAPVVRTEFEKLVERYIDNLIQTFGGEVG